tara:strand:+ start:2642 stop:2908 length:267 start_codon:yes stop_codon:yes gene_type:complete
LKVLELKVGIRGDIEALGGEEDIVGLHGGIQIFQDFIKHIGDGETVIKDGVIGVHTLDYIFGIQVGNYWHTEHTEWLDPGLTDGEQLG